MNQASVLNQIEKGMTVYDRNHDQVGTVSYVQLSDELPDEPGPETVTASKAPEPGEESLVRTFAEAFTGEPRMPEEVRQSLLREGFIRVDPGILRADRYVPSDQISSVSSEGVYLNVGGDDLFKA